MSRTVLIERPGDSIVVVTLNRPESRNAVNADMIAEYAEVLRELSRSTTDRVVILTGAGKGFCSGMDQKNSGYEKQMEGGNIDGMLRAQREIADLVLAMRALPQPVIAAVNGAAVGAGMAFALAADIRIAGDRGVFAVGAISIGISGADMGLTWHLPRQVGASRAAEWLLTGRPIRAEEAAHTGLVSRVVESGSLLDDALEMARQIVGNSDFGVKLTKRALWGNIATSDLTTAVENENQTQVLASARLRQVLALESTVTASGQGQDD
ncbi:enoyl-CoA hydratase/isomerase family protein [Nocardia carnea]|uniref:enoyl-CoA hydratase/isomerase family protein n=1 Tax=Nocardia carnea TaxID=37328 RepID=UPI002455F40A|nr:enoyl-CoA hydratase-related protein [Nocardia carnea]